MSGMRRKDREIADRAELASMLDAADSCRLAFAVEGEPYIVPLCFGYAWEGELPLLYFHCAHEGRKLRAMRANPRVCFELDSGREVGRSPSPCGWTMSFASIVGYGLLEELVEAPDRLAGLEAVMRHYGWGGEGSFEGASLAATTVLRLSVTEMSGKRKP
jgi:uncharacterized protein